MANYLPLHVHHDQISICTGRNRSFLRKDIEAFGRIDTAKLNYLLQTETPFFGLCQHQRKAQINAWKTGRSYKNIIVAFFLLRNEKRTVIAADKIPPYRPAHISTALPPPLSS